MTQTTPPHKSDFELVAGIMEILDRVALDAKNGKQVCDIYAFQILDIVRGKDEGKME